MEDNLIGTLSMFRTMGIKPNFSDLARPYGKDRHTISALVKKSRHDILSFRPLFHCIEPLFIFSVSVSTFMLLVQSLLSVPSFDTSSLPQDGHFGVLP